MRTNLIPNPESYEKSLQAVETEDDVISVVLELFERNSSANKEELDQISKDIQKTKNHYITFDDSNEEVSVFGHTGERIVYGAFRHSAILHSVQTSWTYTFQIIKEENKLFIYADSWGSLASTDLESKVQTHLE